VNKGKEAEVEVSAAAEDDDVSGGGVGGVSSGGDDKEDTSEADATRQRRLERFGAPSP